MRCSKCQHDVPDNAFFCQFCGADQRPGAGWNWATAFRNWTNRLRLPLQRSRMDRQIAGVCGGIARYLNIDPALVRLAWAFLTCLAFVPGSIVLGVIAYIAAIAILPEAEPGTETMGTVPSERRLERSVTSAKVAGVCSGLAAYFAVDVTVVRFLWVILSIFPGFLLGGLLAYVVAWASMPCGRAPTITPEPSPVDTP